MSSSNSQVVFDKMKLRNAHRSFVDAVILEIILPDSQYPRHVLFECLHMAIEDSPSDGNRFPQLLWDAVGDLAVRGAHVIHQSCRLTSSQVTVRFLDVLDGALMPGQKESWSTRDPDISPEHLAFFEATTLSKRASQDTKSYEDVLYPLSKAKTPKNVETFWKLVEEVRFPGPITLVC